MSDCRLLQIKSMQKLVPFPSTGLSDYYHVTVVCLYILFFLTLNNLYRTYKNEDLHGGEDVDRMTIS